MKPIIGVVGRFFKPDDRVICGITESCRKMIIDFGGIPLLILPSKIVDYAQTSNKDILPLTDEEKEIIENQLSLCDGIILPGGNRIYEHDYFIIDYAIKNDVPMLGICLGMQTMGNYPKYPQNEKNDSKIIHFEVSGRNIHDVSLSLNSELYKIIGIEKFEVNSLHNYHVKECNLYKPVAFSDDGYIEAVELNGNKFNFGVQWHPEINYKDSKCSRKLLQSFFDIINKKYGH